MRSLLDINVLIALLDASHTFHERAHQWWALKRGLGWASCPLTENGTIRIMSHPAYSRTRRFSPKELIEALQVFTDSNDHEFWPDAISFRDSAIFVPERLHGSRHLTDIYLLGLAAQKGGRLVTFDQGIPLSTVIGATKENLHLI